MGTIETIHEALENAAALANAYHVELLIQVEDVIRLLDCGPKTERTIPDVQGALEGLEEIRRGLK